MTTRAAVAASERYTVVSADGHGDQAEAKIDFGTDGIKHLVLRYAPLEKL